MNNLKKIKTDQERIAQIHEITSALRIIAATQSRQLTKRRRDYEPIRSESARILYYLHQKGLVPVTNSQAKVHIIFSTDQKFCKKFLNALHEMVLSAKFGPQDRIMLFGSRSYKTVASMVSEDQIELYRALSTYDECESISLKLRQENYPDTYLYSYDSKSSSFRQFRIIPFCSDEELFYDCDDKITDIFYMSQHYQLEHLLHMYLSSEIYFCMVESGLRERIVRAMAMSEASNNAESEANRLKRLYNVTRQAMITKEITNGS